MNSPITTTRISDLQPVLCDNKNCHYNNWLINIQNNPLEFMAAFKEDKYIENHKIIKDLSAINIQKKQETDINTNKDMVSAINKFISEDVSLNFFDAVFKHFKHQSQHLFSFLYTPDTLLQNNLAEKSFKKAYFVAQYIKEKQQIINQEEFCHSLFYALEYDYIDIVKILLGIENISEEETSGLSCWNTRHCCIEENLIFNAIYSFIITKNINNKDLVIETILNIFIKTKYLNQENAKCILIIKLMLNENHRYIINCIEKIIQSYIDDQGNGFIFFTGFNFSKDKNLIKLAKNLSKNCSIEQLDTELSNFKELSSSQINDCRKLYYSFKLNFNYTIDYKNIISLYKLIKTIKINIFT